MQAQNNTDNFDDQTKKLKISLVSCGLYGAMCSGL